MIETADKPTPEEIRELENIPQTIDTPPQSGGMMATTKESLADLQFLADNIDKIITANNKIRLAILRLTYPLDWSKWGEHGELGFSGANRIAATVGVNYSNWSAEKIMDRDDYGEWFRWEYQCDASFRNHTIRVYGRFGSRDKLLGREGGEWKELKDIDEGNIKIAAMRSAKKEGVKDLFGLHSMDLAFLKANGIDLTNSKGYDHKNKEEKSAATLTAVIQIKNVIVKTSPPGSAKKWVKYGIFAVDGSVYGTFDKTMGEQAEKLAGTATKVDVNYTKSTYGNELSSLKAQTEPVGA